MTRDANRLEGLGFVLIAGSLGFATWSIFVAQTLLAASAIVWAIVVVGERRLPRTPGFFLPLLAYAAATLVSAAMSLDPVASIVDSKQLVLLLIVPIVARFARGARAEMLLNVVIALGAAAALYGVVQYNVLGYGDLGDRPSGNLGHYMTYSGVLMLLLTAAVARVAFYQREWIWPAIAIPALAAALAFTKGRNAYIGAFLGISTIVALRKPKLLLLVPVAALALVAIAPADVRDRAYSIVDMNDPTVRDRFAMMEVGAGIVRDYPFFGVGPEMVERVYAGYRPADFVNETNPHLHNVPVQIAAERGLIALVVWFWFVAVAGLDLFEQARRGPAKMLAVAGLAAMVGMLAAGMFEYNFGDSEFLMLLLGLITLPFAGARSAAPPPAAGTATT